jgi:hypothetical protein
MAANYFLGNFYFLIQLVNIVTSCPATDEKGKTMPELWQSRCKL